MNIVNLTPHDVVLLEEGYEDGPPLATFRAIWKPLRLETRGTGQTRLVDGLEIEDVEFGVMLDPPAEVVGRWYIVSLPVALATRRPDFLVPFEEVRNAAGQIIGCRRLARVV